MRVSLCVFSPHSGGVCDGHAVLSGDLLLLLSAHIPHGLPGEQAVRLGPLNPLL